MTSMNETKTKFKTNTTIEKKNSLEDALPGWHWVETEHGRIKPCFVPEYGDRVYFFKGDTITYLDKESSSIVKYTVVGTIKEVSFK